VDRPAAPSPAVRRKIKRPDHGKGLWCFHGGGFVERTTAVLNRCRSMAKHWQNLNRKALAFLVAQPFVSGLESFIILRNIFGQTLRILKAPRFGEGRHS
jgi:hypothetical protein